MSWYSNLVSKTSNQISSLRSTLLSGEADGDTDDDTHVCRVLRGYYSEKGRPLPAWLPPDPKAAAQPPPQPLLVNNNVGQRYGGMGGAPQQPASGLSSLWDNGPASAPAAPQSLRAGGRVPASMQPGGDIQRRPVGGQRAGSYNTAASPFGRSEAASVPPGAAAGGGGGSGGGTSAQALLRQRLWGGSRTTSPSQQGNGQGPFAPPAGSGGGGGGGGNYEDRFAPGGMYDNSGDGHSQSSRRQGLPSGPRGYR